MYNIVQLLTTPIPSPAPPASVYTVVQLLTTPGPVPTTPSTLFGVTQLLTTPVVASPPPSSLFNVAQLLKAPMPLAALRAGDTYGVIFNILSSAPYLQAFAPLSDGVLPQQSLIAPSPHVDLIAGLSDGNQPTAPVTASALFRELITLSDGELPYWPIKTYLVTFEVIEGPTSYEVSFFVAEKVIGASYNVGFFVAEGRRYDVTFAINERVREKTVYDQVIFNVQQTDRLYSRYDVVFTVLPSSTSYDVSFDVLQEPTRYDVTFTVATAGETISYDVYADVIELWIPVTLGVTVSPEFPGNIPPSPNKHRINARVWFGDVLGGAGYAAVQWNGLGPTRLRVVVEDIPQELGPEMRVVVYNSGRVIIDSTEPTKPIWEGNYGTA